MADKIARGASIISDKWLQLKMSDKLLIVSTEKYRNEVENLKLAASRYTSNIEIMYVQVAGIKVGEYFDENPDAFDGFSVIIGATDYSLVTTKTTKKAINRNARYLSLPLDTNNGESLLSFDFFMMDTKKSKMMANILMKYLNSSTYIRIQTKRGTDLKIYKKKRTAGFFNGVAKDGKGFASSSFEVYVAMEETKTEGTMVVDGSLGYLGKVETPTKLVFSKGKLIEIEETSDGKKLKEYIKTFSDERMYIAAELGIGLNSYSECCGNAYIEDESKYGTFHIGLGRNIALGGVQEAVGHFDVVSWKPDIYADNRLVMEQGKIIVPEPEIF